MMMPLAGAALCCIVSILGAMEVEKGRSAVIPSGHTVAEAGLAPVLFEHRFVENPTLDVILGFEGLVGGEGSGGVGQVHCLPELNAFPEDGAAFAGYQISGVIIGSTSLCQNSIAVAVDTYQPRSHIDAAGRCLASIAHAEGDLEGLIFWVCVPLEVHKPNICADLGDPHLPGGPVCCDSGVGRAAAGLKSFIYDVDGHAADDGGRAREPHHEPLSPAIPENVVPLRGEIPWWFIFPALLFHPACFAIGWWIGKRIAGPSVDYRQGNHREHHDGKGG